MAEWSPQTFACRCELPHDASYLIMRGYDEEAATFAKKLGIDLITINQIGGGKRPLVFRVIHGQIEATYSCTNLPATGGSGTLIPLGKIIGSSSNVYSNS